MGAVNGRGPTFLNILSSVGRVSLRFFIDFYESSCFVRSAAQMSVMLAIVGILFAVYVIWRLKRKIFKKNVAGTIRSEHSQAQAQVGPFGPWWHNKRSAVFFEPELIFPLNHY